MLITQLQHEYLLHKLLSHLQSIEEARKQILQQWCKALAQQRIILQTHLQYNNSKTHSRGTCKLHLMF